MIQPTEAFDLDDQPLISTCDGAIRRSEALKQKSAELHQVLAELYRKSDAAYEAVLTDKHKIPERMDT